MEYERLVLYSSSLRLEKLEMLVTLGSPTNESQEDFLGLT